MDTQSFSDDLRRYLSMLWHWAWLLILAAALAGGVAYLYNSQLTPVYQASTSILINEAPTTRANDYSSLLTSERLAQTYVQLLVKQPVLEAVINALQLNDRMSVGKLRASISVQNVKDTQLIDVRVENTNPEMAALIANTLVQEFARQNLEQQASRYTASKQSLEEQMQQLDAQIQKASEDLRAMDEEGADQSQRDRVETIQAQYRQTYAYLLQSYEAIRLAEAQSTSNIVQVEKAMPPHPDYPVRPQTAKNTALAAVVGLMVAVGLVFLIEALDDTLRNPDDIARYLGLPILGVIARHESPNGTPVTASQPRAPVAEAFRSLRTNIQFASVDYPLRRLLVTSPSPADGKSTVAANLAVVLAQSDRRVVMVDTDLRRPKQHRLLRLANRRGVSDLFVQSRVYLDGSLQKTEIPNLFAVTSGSLPPNPSELLGSEKMSEILRMVGEQADLVLLDTPPVLAVTDAVVLAPRSDGVLLVIKPGATKLAAARQAVDQLRRVGATLLGVVLNDVDVKRSRYYYKGYYYAYYDSYGESSNGQSRNGNKKKQPAKVAR